MHDQSQGPFIGAEPTATALNVSFQESQRQKRDEAEAIMANLPTKFRTAIVAITKTHGFNRFTHRATGSLVRRGLAARAREERRDEIRAREREKRDTAQAFRVIGLGRPLRGMTEERYADLVGDHES
jgi:hypothetical protein